MRKLFIQNVTKISQKKLFMCLLLIIIFVFPLNIYSEIQSSNLFDLSYYKRIALVIGNHDYQIGKLKNPQNDAQDISSCLSQLGFSVRLLLNQSYYNMEKSINEFCGLLNYNTVGVFFYAGHALQLHGHNYLIPISPIINTEMELKYKAVNLKLLLEKMEAASNPLNIIIIDACRNNPYARNWYAFSRGISIKGLALERPPNGSVIIYSTRPGEIALDGKGRNSPFSKYLLKYMLIPNLEIGLMIRKIAIDIENETNNAQTPWMEGVLKGKFFFNATDSSSNKNSTIDITKEKDSIATIINRQFSRGGEDYVINIDYPQLADLKIKKVEIEINKFLHDKFLVPDNIKECESYHDLEISYNVEYNNNYVVSLSISRDIYGYMAAHPTSAYDAININTINGKIVTFKDIFLPDFESALENAIQISLKKYLDQIGIDAAEDYGRSFWSKIEVVKRIVQEMKEENCFYFSNNQFVVITHAFSEGPGIFNHPIEISIEDIKDVLHPFGPLSK
jgi:uncharacterized caspase-like protein